jgi:serine/threonine-protein kinase
MDVYEATNGEYQTCVDAGICQAPESSRSAARTSYYGNRAFSRYPVIFVTWEMADTFCRDWRDGRLPTEAEWEYAARSVQEVIYPWGNSSVAPGRLNFCDSGCPFDFADGRFEDGFPDDTSPVGHYEDGASPFGILDMAGNVYEWVADWHGTYSSEAAIDPTGPADGFQKVRRGGAWSNSASFVRLSNRAVGGLSFADDDTGFRCVRDGE